MREDPQECKRRMHLAEWSLLQGLDHDSVWTSGETEYYAAVKGADVGRSWLALLWLQQQVQSEKVVLGRIAGSVNPADLFTKHQTQAEITNHSARLRCQFWVDPLKLMRRTSTLAGGSVILPLGRGGCEPLRHTSSWNPLQVELEGKAPTLPVVTHVLGDRFPKAVVRGWSRSTVRPLASV